jgi:hypothetical protein
MPECSFFGSILGLPAFARHLFGSSTSGSLVGKVCTKVPYFPSLVSSLFSGSLWRTHTHTHTQTRAPTTFSVSALAALLSCRRPPLVSSLSQPLSPPTSKSLPPSSAKGSLAKGSHPRLPLQLLRNSTRAASSSSTTDTSIPSVPFLCPSRRPRRPLCNLELPRPKTTTLDKEHYESIDNTSLRPRFLRSQLNSALPVFVTLFESSLPSSTSHQQLALFFAPSV